MASLLDLGEDFGDIWLVNDATYGVTWLTHYPTWPLNHEGSGHCCPCFLVGLLLCVEKSNKIEVLSDFCSSFSSIECWSEVSDAGAFLDFEFKQADADDIFLEVADTSDHCSHIGCEFAPVLDGECCAFFFPCEDAVFDHPLCFGEGIDHDGLILLIVIGVFVDVSEHSGEHICRCDVNDVGFGVAVRDTCLSVHLGEEDKRGWCCSSEEAFSYS